MKTQENLHELIHSLSKSEKMFFKKYTLLYSPSEASGYIRLFDLIDNANVYNEANIEKKIKAEYPGGNFSFQKNYLKKAILRSLRAIKDEASPNIAFSELLGNVENLRARKLYGMAEKELQKARKHLEQYELFNRFSELAHWERQFIYRKPNSEESTDEFDNLNKEEIATFEKVKNIADYYYLSYKMLVITRTKGNIRDQETKQLTDDFMNNPLLQDESKALSVLAKSFFYNTNLIYADLIGETDKLYDYLKRDLALLDAHKFFCEMNEWKLVVCLFNFVVAVISLEKFEEYETIHGRLKELYEQIKNTNPLLRHNLEILLANIELRYALAMNNLDNLDEIHYEYSDLLIEQDLKSNPHIIVENYLMISYAFLLKSDIKMALKWNNIIINSKVSGLREDMFSMSRILNLIIHYELGNDVLLLYNIRSTFRYLEKMNTLKEFETLILDFIKLLIEFEKRSNHTEKLIELRDKIYALKKNNFEKQAFYVINLLTWIDIKIDESRNPRKYAYKKTK